MNVPDALLACTLVLASVLLVGCDHQEIRSTPMSGRTATVSAIVETMAMAGTADNDSDSLDTTSLDQIVVVDIWGDRHLITDFAVDIGDVENRALVLIFMGSECPVARVYVPTLIDIEREFRDDGIQFVGVFSNGGEDLLDVAEFAQDYELPFPVVKDSDARLADFFDVKRTPEVVVIDRGQHPVYRGRVNDQYRPGGRKVAASHNYLADALTQFAAGESVLVPRTLATGCHIDRRQAISDRNDLTWSDISPIIQRKCQACHRTGGVGPFSLATYEEAVRHTEMIAEVVTDRRMPPLAGIVDDQFGTFSNHPTLTDEELEMVVQWCRGGANAGDGSDGPSTVDFGSTDLIADPDVVLEMQEAVAIPADGTLSYRYFQLPTHFDEDKWVTACEVVPSDPSVVHHVIAHISGRRKQLLFGLGAIVKLNGFSGENARWVGQYTVGDGLVRYPPGVAMRVPARSYVTLEVHYMPNGKPTQDRTRVLMTLSDEPPKHRVRSVVFNKRGFTIPAHDPYLRIDNTWRFEKPSMLLSIRPHMHYRGKHWRYTLRFPDGREATLLKVPRWHYDWQLGAIFDTPIPIPAGTELLITAIYDNSTHNPNNPDPTVDVHWGLQDVDEMMAGGMRIVELSDADAWSDSQKPSG
ncbi:MAG: redoxin domain-containing protein [Pirellulaceae bacterium]|nr:redoxin domain-containing protein [Pirellulaceae bacterium]